MEIASDAAPTIPSMITAMLTRGTTRLTESAMVIALRDPQYMLIATTVIRVRKAAARQIFPKPLNTPLPTELIKGTNWAVGLAARRNAPSQIIHKAPVADTTYVHQN